MDLSSVGGEQFAEDAEQGGADGVIGSEVGAVLEQDGLGEQVGGAAEGDAEAHLLVDRVDSLLEVGGDPADLVACPIDDRHVGERRGLVDEDVHREAVDQQEVDEALEELAAGISRCRAACRGRAEPRRGRREPATSTASSSCSFEA